MKRCTLLLLCLALLFSFAGCSGRQTVSVVDIATEYAMGNMSVTYPRLEGTTDGTKIPAVNHRIKTDILERVYNESLYQLSQVTADINYEITLQTETLISLVYTGSLQIDGAAYPTNVIYTATFNLQTGEQVAFSDLVRPENKLAEKMTAAPITAVTETAALGIDAYRPQLDDKAVMENYGQNSEFTFHLTGDGLVLSFPVPHAAGDYALMTVAGNFTI